MFGCIYVVVNGFVIEFIRWSSDLSKSDIVLSAFKIGVSYQIHIPLTKQNITVIFFFNNYFIPFALYESCKIS